MTNIMLFENLESYKVVRLDSIHNKIIPYVYETLGCKERGNMNTDPWMNRFTLMRKKTNVYMLIPSVVPSYQNLPLATSGKFIVAKLNELEKEFSSIEPKDEEYVMKHFKEQFSEDNLKKRELETIIEKVYAHYFHAYRRIFAPCSDETLNHIRTLLSYNLKSAKMIIGSMDTKESMERILAMDPVMSTFYLEVYQALVRGRLEYGTVMNRLCDLDIVLEDEYLLGALIHAVEPESIRIMRKIMEDEAPKKYKIKDIKEELVREMLFGFLLYYNHNTGKYSIYKKINEDPIKDPFGCNVTEAFLYSDKLDSEADAKHFVSKIMDEFVKRM